MPRSQPAGAAPDGRSGEPSGPPPSTAAPDFDEVYRAGRRRLLLQAYLLTGDLAASRSAVRDAYVAAAQRWRTVGGLADPEEWVRARAWSQAQRRHVGRRRDRDQGADDHQSAVLRAVLSLPDRYRRTLLLVHLAGLDHDDVARELGLPPARVATLLERARTRLRRRVDLPAPEADDGSDPAVTDALQSLTPLVDAVALPAGEQLRLQGSRRARRRVVAGVAAAVAVTLLGGFLVVQPGSADESVPAGPEPRPVTAEMLLRASDVASLDRQQRWREVGTGDNTEGDGINTVCQSSRFADPEGEGTLVRSFASAGQPRRTLLQTVEVSSTAAAARAAYATTLGWFAGCSEARLQLLDSYRINGLGARAEVLRLRLPTEDGRPRSYVVGLTRSDRVTVSTVAETRGGASVQVRRAAALLERGVKRLCESDPAGTCPVRTEVRRVLPPPSGEAPGTLAATDLPPVGRVNRPWVGTRPALAQAGDAATSCDRTRFRRSGAPRATSRTYVIPQADLPPRFGVTQTVGTFRDERRARQLVDDVVAAMAACEDDDLAAAVSQEQEVRDGFRGSTVAIWRLDRELEEDRSIGYWMGVARVGRHATQVLFTPSGDADMDQDTFRAVVNRARDRLLELRAGR